MRSIPRLLVVSALLCVSALATTTSIAAASTASHSISCALAPSSMVSSALGFSVGAAKVTDNGSTVVCLYPKGKNFAGVTVRLQSSVSTQGFATDRQQFDAHGEKTTTIKNLGEVAYSSSIGTGQYATYSVVVLKHKVELLVAAQASIAKLESLARKILNKI